MSQASGGKQTRSKKYEADEDEMMTLNKNQRSPLDIIPHLAASQGAAQTCSFSTCPCNTASHQDPSAFKTCTHPITVIPKPSDAVKSHCSFVSAGWYSQPNTYSIAANKLGSSTTNSSATTNAAKRKHKSKSQLPHVLDRTFEEDMNHKGRSKI